MLTEYEKLRLVDIDNHDTGIKIEVNWNPENEQINKCKILRFTLPDGKQFCMKKEQFMSYLWLFGKEEEHQKMIPEKISTVRWYETVVSVKAKKDIKKGENITFPIKISLPAVTQEIIGGLKKDLKKKTNLWTP